MTVVLWIFTHEHIIICRIHDSTVESDSHNLVAC
jgi:hypothetical protein